MNASKPALFNWKSCPAEPERGAQINDRDPILLGFGDPILEEVER